VTVTGLVYGDPMVFAIVLAVLLALALGVLIGLFLGARSGPGGLQPEALAAVDRSVHQSVSSQAQVLRQDLRHVTDLVGALRSERAEQDGRLSAGLQHSLQVTNQLALTTQLLRDALASPKARGQWGERMAEDVLRLAGFVDGVSYSKQLRLASGAVPDFTFHLPKGRVVHMDVKFPIDNYLRWLQADSEPDKELLVKAFRRDARNRLKELADRNYIDPAHTIDQLLLFIPNESVYGFLHQHDPHLIDLAIQQKVVLCSPTSLFAVLAVIRQSVDNFMIERQSDEILAGIAGLRNEWDRFTESVMKLSRGLDSAQRAADDLVGPRTRQFEKKLDQLQTVRDRPAEPQPDSNHEARVSAVPIRSLY